MTFKAAILEKINAPLVVRSVTNFDPAYGQVFVRILSSGICGAQLQEIRGEKGNRGHLPHLLGHEGCGIVEEIGGGVSRVERGDKVVMHWRKAEGLEGDFPTYCGETPAKNPDGTTDGPAYYRAGKITTLSEYAIISENRLTPVPHDTPNDLCALLGCGLSTALGTIESEAKVMFGESVMIVGAGGLGANLIRCACMAHANPIVAVDIHDNKAVTAYELGATRYINSATEGLRDAGKFDVIIETSGNAMAETLPLLAPSGRFIMVGQPKPGRSVRMTNANHLFQGEGKTIKATQGGGFKPDRDIPRYVALWRAGLLKIDGIITKRLPLRHVNKGLDLVRAGQASRVIIDMSL